MITKLNNLLSHNASIYFLKKIVPLFMLLIFISICFLSQDSESVTVDEFVHFPAGIYILKTRDWRMDNAAPPLIKCFPALSSIFTHPEIDTKSFQASPDLYGLGYNFMYLNNDRYKSIFSYGRCMIIFLGFLLGVLIYLWSREIYGYKGALFALLLFVFNPNILAHSSLITMDVGVSLTIFFSVYCLWKYLKKQNTFSTIIAGVALGLAQLSKFTALLLYPIYFLIFMSLCITGIYQYKEERLKVFKAILFKYSKDFIIIIIVSIFIINLGYLFSGSFTLLSEYHFSSRLLKSSSSLIGNWFPVPLPYNYLIGFDSQLTQAAGGNPFYAGYLMGEHSLSGWWYYYIIAFLVKNPVSLLIILCLAIIALFEIKIVKKDITTFLCIGLPTISYFIYFSFFTNIPIGIRYLLPVFPFLFLASGYLLNESVIKFKSMQLVLAFLIISYITSSLITFPNYLSYFNMAAGGSKNGDRWLIDSNLDWGQSLPGLKKYMDKNHIREIKLGYFGRVDPTIYGIHYSIAEKEPQEGIYAISINFLVGRPYYLLKEKTGELFYIDINYFDKYRYLKPSAVIDNSIYIFDVRKKHIDPSR
jgi:hypothetical protein